MQQTNYRSIEIGDRRVDYSIRISERAQRYRIIISPQGVELILPRGVPLFRADALMRSHSGWLDKQLERMVSYQKRAEKRKAKEISLPEDTILFRGNPCRLEINRSSSMRNQVKIIQHDGRICIDAPEGKNIDLEAHLQAFLKKYAGRLVTDRVQAWAGMMKLQPKRISIRSQRTRWGSCSSRGTVSFNWRLVMATPEVLDYVVIHELAHLAVHNHSTRFWEIVAANSPKYKQHRKWLRDQQGLLYRALINGKK
jgi:predicted metal-dependent hydrolase